IRASKADGAHESGLTALIWNQVLSYGTDAMITVALAGTVFFGASSHAQRGNVLLYLLITMAPFAVVAPIIGPVLDRFQHGRRWTMAATAIGRGVLALIMADHSSELLVLYPCALGSLVLSKAYVVLRAAAAPRLVPRGMSLTEANARLSIFGLGSTLVLGGFVGLVIKLTGSYSTGLVLSAIGFGTCAFFAFRLPSQVDSATPAPVHPGEAPRPPAQHQVPPLERLRTWAQRGFEPHIVTALQAESVLRLLSGLLTIYLAFYIEGTAHGFQAAAELAAVIAAAGVGNIVGTAIGTKVKLHQPERVVSVSTIVAALTCLIVALAFDVTFAVAGILIAMVANALSKIALDALIQRDVPETLRSSAFARSETFLQLSWVLGAAIGVVLPSSSRGDGPIGFWVATAVVGTVAVLVVLRQRVLAADRARRAWGDGPHGTGPVGEVPR
ncbi:MAG: MFS transporter, partial [Jatrophihabitans sp.]